MSELTLELDRATLMFYLNQLPDGAALIPFIEALLTSIASADKP